MALWAMGDFHLAFSVDKPMEVFDPIWKNHEKKIQKYVTKCVKDTDTIVITGDHSWGRNLEECETDLKFIEELPGRKILLRGNHDMFWDAKKTQKLNNLFQGKLELLQNNFYNYQDYALVGTKGYCYEGKDSIEHFLKLRTREIDRLRVSFNDSFEGRLQFLQNNYYNYGDYALVGTKGYCYEGKDSIEHFLKIREREGERLRISFDKAKADGYSKFIMFLHYPPTTIGEQESPFTQMAEEYGAAQVIYSHCHGRERYDDSFKGEVNGIMYRLVSSDYLKFRPERIL